MSHPQNLDDWVKENRGILSFKCISYRCFSNDILRIAFKVSEISCADPSLFEAIYLNYPVKSIRVEYEENGLPFRLQKDKVCSCYRGTCNHKERNDPEKKKYIWIEQKIPALEPHPVFQIELFLERLINQFSDRSQKEIELIYGQFISEQIFWKQTEEEYFRKLKDDFSRRLSVASKKLGMATLELMGTVSVWAPLSDEITEDLRYELEMIFSIDSPIVVTPRERIHTKNKI